MMKTSPEAREDLQHQPRPGFALSSLIRRISLSSRLWMISSMSSPPPLPRALSRCPGEIAAAFLLHSLNSYMKRKSWCWGGSSKDTELLKEIGKSVLAITQLSIH